ncbi:Alpha/Beta hydrolase protein [Cokeromyces recurvatus]|uniref:Alpha/Beta hydrolase protein n=1 Tax=Cokeromyces recurvatus TaxID=90255 RepID=UPI0022210A52|nr:Alpha/Beta hydrolase protein [Cokeromyces recurvatus]KAI7898268.1 Alpha/Beta hydrolase protein [Cokeromyces recurvatus]
MQTEFDVNILEPASKAFIQAVRSMKGDNGKKDFDKEAVDYMINAPLSKNLCRPAVTIEHIQIPLRQEEGDGHMINVDVYRPQEAKGILSAFVFLHGGGWTLPVQNGHIYLAEKISAEANCAVLLVHYTCGLTVPHSKALDECYSVVAYATSTEGAKKLFINPANVAIGGDSAGGNMAACIALLAKEKKPLGNPLKLQVLYYPNTTDSIKTSKSYQEYGYGNILNIADVENTFKLHFTEEDKNNPYVFPLKATTEQISGIAPALLITCEADVLRDEGELYGRKLLEAGVPVNVVRICGVIHTFLSLAPLYSEATENVLDMTTGALRRAFSKKN